MDQNLQDADYQPQAKVIENPPKNQDGSFDLRVHIKNAKTGLLIREQNHNIMVVSGIRYFEQPVGSGNLFYESGKQAGRWVPAKSTTEQGYCDEGKPHIAYVEPQTNLRTQEGVLQENEALRAELAALQADKEAQAEKAQASAKPEVKAKQN